MEDEGWGPLGYLKALWKSGKICSPYFTYSTDAGSPTSVRVSVSGHYAIETSVHWLTLIFQGCTSMGRYITRYHPGNPDRLPKREYSHPVPNERSPPDAMAVGDKG
ncbi:hypothetical protein TNCV_2773581 [Trichonephila clavipes]|nr:hypothetical protein TNCV_2773581 [Trichonephila clavipes]